VECYPDKSERYPDTPERYPDAGGTLSRFRTEVAHNPVQRLVLTFSPLKPIAVNGMGRRVDHN